MSAPQIEVLITVDGVEHARHVLAPGDYVIGRNSDCPIRVDADLVSRQHAKLILNYDHALIEDLGSSNGTQVNGQPIAKDGRTRLWPNQKIQIGTATIELRRLQGEAPTDMSLAPAQRAVRDMLPAELLREKKYDIGAVVARGGMGAILDAKEAAIKRRVAMKVMLDTNDADAIARFVAEAQVTGQLEHPNIVPVHELGVDENGQVFYTMQMVRGITLKKVLELLAKGVAETVQKFPLSALLTVFQKVCDAIAFAHSKGVIHRDLKPENIMLGDFGSVLVMDWGLAKRVGNDEIRMTNDERKPDSSAFGIRHSSFSGTLAGTIMGTPQYMAPEQARGEIETLDARADIYALGAILYHILALRPAVSGKDAWDIVGKVGRGEIEPLESVTQRRRGAKKDKGSDAKLSPSAPPRLGVTHLPGGRIPDSLAAVVRKAMALDKAARYPHVADFQRDIEAYQNGFATGAEKARKWKRFTLFVRRNKAASIGVAAVLVLSIGFMAKVIAEGRRAERGEAKANAALADLKASAPALLQLAESEAGFQRFESALDKLDAALALDPAHLPGYWRRAWLFIGMDRLADAAAAIRLAQQKDPARPELAAILPTVEKLAASPDAGSWPADSSRALYEHLTKVEASGEMAALSAKMSIGANAKEKLIRQRLDEWLGKGKGTIQVWPPGDLFVSLVRLPIDTLAPLHGLPITALEVMDTKVASLEPLRGMPLTGLNISNTNVASLEPLRGMRLVHLTLYNTKVADLSPLRGMPLRLLALNGSKVSDLSPLRGMPLETFHASSQNIVDFSPLRGAPLRVVAIQSTGARDLSFLQDAPVEELDIGGNAIPDFSPLFGKPLRKLLARDATVRDLSPLRGAPIAEMDIRNTRSLTDFTPLLDLPKLERLSVSTVGKLLEPLRTHASLKFIAQNLNPYRPVAEFWADYDAQQAPGKR